MEQLVDESVLLQKIRLEAKGKGALRQLKVIHATIDSLNRFGLQRTTYDSVARLAKMQRSHVAYYFKTFDQLILAAIRFSMLCAQEITIAHIEHATSAKERLIAMLDGAFAHLEKYPKQAYILTLFWSQSSLSKEYRRQSTEMRKMGLERIKLLLELYWGNVTDKNLLQDVAKAFQCLGYGYILEAIAADTYPSINASREAAIRAAIRLIEAR